MQRQSDPLDGRGAHGLSRRGFLHVSAAGAALLTTVSVLASARRSHAADAPAVSYVPRALNPGEFAILTAFCDTMLPVSSPSPAEAGVAKRIDTELTFHPNDRLLDDVRSALAVVEYGPYLDGYFRRFTQLDEADRTAYLRGVTASRLQLRRDALSGLRLLAVFLYYTDARTWPDIHYEGPAVPRKLPEAANALEVIG